MYFNDVHRCFWSKFFLAHRWSNLESSRDLMCVFSAPKYFFYKKKMHHILRKKNIGQKLVPYQKAYFANWFIPGFSLNQKSNAIINISKILRFDFIENIIWWSSSKCLGAYYLRKTIKIRTLKSVLTLKIN